MSDSISDLFGRDAESFHQTYMDKNNVMSFEEYLTELEQQPRLHIRDAARYLLDAIDYYGTEVIHRPWGEESRYKIFNQAFASPSEQLVGQEAAQAAIREAVESQVREGRINKLLLIHGPNGSAKSTTIKNLFAGLEHYSALSEGMLYRFRWIFPTRKTSHGALGFGARMDRDNIETFAHLEDSDIDATLECEVRDHPLLLLPLPERARLIRTLLDRAGFEEFPIPQYFLGDTLCHRCRQVADALTRTHRGDLRKVLAHVQVERWQISRRYRRGTVQVGPQMSTDAAQRQVTADRNLNALPIELQNMTLFETYGPLVDGSGGVVEFEDMLKRSLESFKYLLGTIETGEVLLGQSILRLNTVLMGTSNDAMLEAFREHHEYPSFLERITLIPVPFITQYSTEKRIYELQLLPNLGRHTAPHAVTTATHFAALGRLLKPSPDAYPEALRPVIEGLTAAQKAALYDHGEMPESLDESLRASLKDALKEMRREHSTTWAYEGRFGPSPRVIRQVLMRAAQSKHFHCLSPFEVLNELDDLCEKVREHPFLERESEPGGYHDFRAFVDIAADRLFDKIEADVRDASGLVEESRYRELLGKYVSHVRYAVNGEKVTSESTGQDEDPDESMMASIEEKLGIAEAPEEFRKNLISRIAAWAIEHPRQKILPEEIFPEHLRKIRNAYFQEHRKKVVKVAKNALSLLSGEADGLDKADRDTAEKMVERLVQNHGYCTHCVTDAVARLISRRFESEHSS